MDRPHRQLDREAGEESEPQPSLGIRREIIRHQRRDRRRVRLDHHVQHGDQHQHRAEQGVEEEFVARLDALGPAPDADDQIHRDQAALEEDVEQEQVLGGKDADHQRLHQQEGGHIFGHALLDRAPAGADADRHQKQRQHDQHHGDAVDAQRPVDPAAEPDPLDELPLRAGRIVGGPQPGPERQVDQRRHQRDPARRTGADEQANQPRDERQADEDRQHGQSAHAGHRAHHTAQLAAPIRPRSITSA